MSTYELRITPPQLPRTLRGRGASPITRDVLTEQLTDAVISEHVENGYRDYRLRLELARESHVDALNEVLTVVQRLGYAEINGTISEWTSRTVETAVAGAFGGGGTAALTSRDVWISTIFGFAGMVLGAIVGSELRRVEKVYRVQLTASGWQFAEVPREQWSPRPVPQPA
jgi:hypothetical protein